jgi:hypothetical protein
MVAGVLSASRATPTQAEADGQLIPVIFVTEEPCSGDQVAPALLVATGFALPPATQSSAEAQATVKK